MWSLQLVDVVGDAPPRFVPAQLVRQVDFDGSLHSCDSGPPFSALQAGPGEYHARNALDFGPVAVRRDACPGSGPLVVYPPVPAPAPVPQSGTPPPTTSSIGQDELGYRVWYGASLRQRAGVKGFNDYLAQWGVSGIVPTWQLLRTATSWQRCGGAPFEVPPSQRMAAHRPDASLHQRLCDPDGRTGRSRLRLSQSVISTSAPAERPRARTSIIRRSTWSRFARPPARS